MVERAKAFHWVAVDRDRTPEIPKRLNVSAYPSVLVLGPKEENVHRFEGFSKKGEFLARLDGALRRHALFREGKAFDAPDPRPERIADGDGVSSIPAPSDGIPAGLAFLGEDLFVGQGESLFRVDPATGTVKATLPLPAGIADLDSDGKVLYAVPFAWTAGEPILVLDPETGKTLRSLTTEANRKNRHSGAKGVAWHGDHLDVLEGMEGRTREVDPATGALGATIGTNRRWLSGLAAEGRFLVTASREAIVWIFTGTGTVEREIPVHYAVRSLAVKPGTVYAMEQPVFGYGRKHERVQVWPRAGETRIWRIRR